LPPGWLVQQHSNTPCTCIPRPACPRGFRNNGQWSRLEWARGIGVCHLPHTPTPLASRCRWTAAAGSATSHLTPDTRHLAARSMICADLETLFIIQRCVDGLKPVSTCLYWTVPRAHRPSFGGEPLGWPNYGPNRLAAVCLRLRPSYYYLPFTLLFLFGAAEQGGYVSPCRSVCEPLRAGCCGRRGEGVLGGVFREGVNLSLSMPLDCCGGQPPHT